jgi:autotransporter-associated beta strand protein
VQAGGAFIDDGGFAITIGQALVHDVALDTPSVTPDGGLTKSNTGTLTLSGVNTYTGATIIKAGTLSLTSTGSISDSGNLVVGDAGSSGAVLDVTAKTGGFTIGSSQKLSGIGKVDANDGANKHTVSLAGGAIHAVGNSTAHAGVGKQTIDGNLTYGAGSIFEWNLNGNTADSGDRGIAGGYDAVDGTGALTVDATENTGTVFRIVLGSGVDLANGFWATPHTTHTWSNIFSGFSGLTGGFDNSNIEVTGQTTDGIGSFTINGTSLTWTAVPEPTSALAGILLGAGLLCRRRSA